MRDGNNCCGLWTLLQYYLNNAHIKGRISSCLKRTEKVKWLAFHSLAVTVASLQWLCSWQLVHVNSFLAWQPVNISCGLCWCWSNEKLTCGVISAEAVCSGWPGKEWKPTPVDAFDSPSKLRVCSFYPILCAALGTFAPPGRWLKHFCTLCLSFYFSHREGDLGHLPQTDTAGFTAMTLFHCF